MLKDFDIEIQFVEEIQRSSSTRGDGAPLLAIGLLSRDEGMICVFDVVNSRIIRAVLISGRVRYFYLIITDFNNIVCSHLLLS